MNLNLYKTIKTPQAMVFAGALAMSMLSPLQTLAQDLSYNDFYFTIDSGSESATLAGYFGQEVNLEIPSTVSYGDQEYKVTGVADYAFYYSPVESVVFGEYIRQIGYGAFYSAALTSVSFNEKLESVGAQSFANCQALTSITLPSSLISIDDYAFMNTSISGELLLPENLSSWGASPFRGTPLTSFSIVENNDEFLTEGGVLFSKDMTTLISYPCGKPESEYSVPSGITTIGSEAMRNSLYLTSVNLPETLERIASLAFASDYITSVSIPSCVSEIERGAFYYTTDLQEISVDSGNEVFEVNQKLLINRNTQTVIAAAQGLSQLSIPEGIVRVEDYVFYGYSTLQSVALPSSLRSIGQQSFVSCSSLEAVQLAEGIETIGNAAFQNCFALKTVSFPQSLRTIEKQAFANCVAMEEAILNDGLVAIGQSAFYGCTGLAKVRVPGTATEFGYSIFYGCDNLREAVLEEGLTIIPDQMFNYDSNLSVINIPSTVTVIDEAALYGTAVSSLDLPDGLVTIGDMALYGTQLEELTLPDSVETVGNFAFAYNYSLRSVKCGSGLKCIGDNAFSSLPVLEKIELNEGLEYIGYEGITFCDVLTTIEIPSTVTEIGSYAFIGSPLQSIVNKAVEPQFQYEGEDIVADPEGQLIYDSCVLYVPEESLAAYSDAPVWGLFSNIKPISSTGITIPESVDEATIVNIYSIDGKQLTTPVRGINIYRTSDGKTRKGFVRK